VSHVVRAVLCDDTAEIRSLLRWELQRGDTIDVVGEAGDSEAAVHLIKSVAPELVVLDLWMPSLEPAALLASVARALPEILIVTFSGFELNDLDPDSQRLVALHLPKTTPLQLVHQALIELVTDSPVR
jgi:DNA-binding NarL/FixJ family response regulator